MLVKLFLINLYLIAIDNISAIKLSNPIFLIYFWKPRYLFLIKTKYVLCTQKK